MDLKEKLKKIKNKGIKRIFELPENEKTGVVNGLLLLGAAIGALISQQHTASGSATPTNCIDDVNQKVTDTDISPGAANQDLGFTLQSWADHCWHDHCWWDFWDFWDFNDFSDSGGDGG